MPLPIPPGPDADSASGPADPRAQGVTSRVLVLAGALVPLNAFFVLFMSYERNIFDPTLVALFWNVLFLLVVVRLINQALLRWRPAAAFSPAETAKLVMVWAQNPKADFARLAEKLGQDLGRALEARAVRQELERLSLVEAPGSAAASAKAH